MTRTKSDGQRDLDRGYTDADLAEVSDNPEWTVEDFARALPFAETFPDLAEGIRSFGVEMVGSSEVVQLRLDASVLAHLRASGPGWEARMNEALKKVAGL